MTEATATPADRARHIETFNVIWQGITLEITFEPHWMFLRAHKVAHLTVCSVAPDRAPLPITETGYRSLFIAEENITDYGDPVAFMLAWLDEEARNPAWREQHSAEMQLTLF